MFQSLVGRGWIPFAVCLDQEFVIYIEILYLNMWLFHCDKGNYYVKKFVVLTKGLIKVIKDKSPLKTTTYTSILELITVV